MGSYINNLFQYIYSFSLNSVKVVVAWEWYKEKVVTVILQSSWLDYFVIYHLFIHWYLFPQKLIPILLKKLLLDSHICIIRTDQRNPNLYRLRLCFLWCMISCLHLALSCWWKKFHPNHYSLQFVKSSQTIKCDKFLTGNNMLAYCQYLKL